MLLYFGPILGHPVFYLDPGSGSFLIQLLLAGALGVGIAVKMYWAKIKSIFSGKKAEPASPTEDEDEE